MDKKYIELLKNLAQATAITAEQVVEYDRQKNDEKGIETAKIMRDDFQSLLDAMNNLGNEYQLNRTDTARLLVAAMIQTNQLQDRINSLKKAIDGYQKDIIPKLQEILDVATSDEDAIKLANEKFIIENNK